MYYQCREHINAVCHFQPYFTCQRLLSEGVYFSRRLIIGMCMFHHLRACADGSGGYEGGSTGNGVGRPGLIAAVGCMRETSFRGGAHFHDVRYKHAECSDWKRTAAGIAGYATFRVIPDLLSLCLRTRTEMPLSCSCNQGYSMTF
jgi:hypothetical protein